jgi:hypothetical protein
MKSTIQEYICTVPIMEGIDIVLYMGAKKVWHRDWMNCNIVSIRIRAETIHCGHTIQVDKRQIKMIGNWDERMARMVADEYLMRFRSKVDVREGKLYDV